MRASGIGNPGKDREDAVTSLVGWREAGFLQVGSCGTPKSVCGRMRGGS